MPGTYTVPDNPADPEAGALEDSLPPSVQVSLQRLCMEGLTPCVS
jgi:hypothetical protein